MAEENKYVTYLLKKAKTAAGVPVYHAPVTSAGEKIIYRTTIGYSASAERAESVVLVLKFISRDGEINLKRSLAVTRALLREGREVHRDDFGGVVLSVSADGGESGYIGRTGHYYLTVRYTVKRYPSGDEAEGTCADSAL